MFVVRIPVRCEAKRLTVDCKAKGGMMLEDCGGSFTYMKMRNFQQRRSGMTKAERMDFLLSIGFESEEHFNEWTNFREVDIPEINDELENLGE